MRGFVYKRAHKRKDGKVSTLYYAVIEVTPPGQTRRKQDWGKGYLTRGEADRALRERVRDFDNQAYVPNRKLTFGDYLAKEWLPLLKDRIKPTTLNSYERIIYGYVVPRIGGVGLRDLSVGHLNRLYAELRESGGTWQGKAKRTAKKPLAQKTVRNVHVVISKSLNDAIDAGLLVTNVAGRAKPPRQRGISQNIEAWTADELAEFLDYVREDRLYACWHLAAYTGLRRGELLGLRWKDLDLASAHLAVRQTLTLVYTTPTISTPKSHDARVVNLDAVTVKVLQEHHRFQTEERKAYGLGYVDSGPVFRREDGHWIHPDRLSQLFDKFVRHAGIRRIKFHGLRHTHATLMLKANVPVKVVSERLGHSDPAFTLRVYQHVLSGMQAEAASAFAAVLYAVVRVPTLPTPVVATVIPMAVADENEL